MAERGFQSYDDFYAWSIAEPQEFWSFAVDKLGLRFSCDPTTTLNLDDGLEHPNWLVDAKLNIVDSCFAADPDSCAVIERSSDGRDRTTTYRQLKSLARRIVEGLRQTGTVPGDAIAVFLPMTTEAIAIYLAIIGAGCTVVSIADSFSSEQVAARLRIGEAKRVVTVRSIRRGDKTVSVYSRIVEANGPPAIVIEPTAEPEEDTRDEDISWSDFLPATSSTLDDDTEWDTVQLRPESGINILFSSGTTGDPKAIVWDHTTAIKAAADGYFHQDIQPGEVTAWPTNLGWMMGPWLIFATFINRATLAIYTGAPSDTAFGPFVEDHRINILGVVPSMVKAWRESGTLAESDWTAVKAFSSTGECSNPSDMQWLSEFAGRKPIIEYCGGTEIGGGYITSTLVQPNFASMFSTPALGSAMVLIDEDGQLSDEGEVYLVPPAMGLSRRLLNRDHHEVYFANAPRLPDMGSNEDKILRRHGDQLVRVANGHYQVLGRADDTMNLGGIKVGTAEIERVVSSVQDVRELAAIAVSATDGGPSRLVVYVAIQPDSTLDVATIKKSMQQSIRQQLNPLFKIHDIVLVPQLPRTASNKIMRRHLRDDWMRRSS